MARVVVIGAGLGGLAVAARLAALGHRVTVCEQAERVGGKAAAVQREGFRFDTGPHLLTLPSVYRDLFDATGGPLSRELDLVPVEPAFRYRFADGVKVDIPNASRAGTAKAWEAATGGPAGADWLRLMDRSERIWSAVEQPFLRRPVHGIGQLLSLAHRLDDLRAVAPWQSLRGLGRRYLADPHQRMALERYATYTGSDPRRAPAALATVGYLEEEFGAWYVPGGLHRLAEVVHARALERGARVRTGADVTGIELTAGRASGVRLADGQRLPADVVVANADAEHVYRDLFPASFRPAARALARLRRCTPSLSGFVLLLALRGRTPGLCHHTVLFPEHYDDEFDAVFGTGPYRETGPRPVQDPAVYISAPDDPALRPDADHEGWFVLVNAARHTPGPASGPAPEGRAAGAGLGGGRAGADAEGGGHAGVSGSVDPHRGVDWRAPGLAEAYGDHLLTVLARRGLDVRDRVRWRIVRTPADLERESRCPGGSIYGTSSNGHRAAFLRPANRSPVPGLYLVGGSAHPGGGIPLVGLSAAIVADLIGAS